MIHREVLIFWCLESVRIKNLAFWCCAKSVGLFPARLDPAWNEPSDTPLSTTEHLKLIETYLYTPRYYHISPIHLQSCIRHKQTSTDTDRQQEILFSSCFSFLFCPGRPSSWSWWTMQRSRSSRWTRLLRPSRFERQTTNKATFSLYFSKCKYEKKCSGHCWHDLHVQTVPEDQGQLWCE